MDASNTCALVNTVPFTDYANIVDSSSRLIEFNIAGGRVTGLFDKAPSNMFSNDFSTFLTTPQNFPVMGFPTLVSGTSSIVRQYLEYPKSGSSYSNDYYTAGNFRDLSSVVEKIIKNNDLCSSSNIYNPNVYNGSNLDTVSLTILYQVLASSNVNPLDATTIQNKIDMFQNKNKMFYSFFVYEYCYYNTMYNAVLAQYFNEYTNITPTSRLPNITYLKDSTGNNVTVANTAVAQASRLDGIVITMARINSRLSDMRNLLSAIQDYYSASLQTLQAALNNSTNIGSDSYAQSKIMYLKNQSKGVEQAKDDSVVRQGIMEYTSEKNRYANILLGIYAFLNIAIIAVIFNIKE
jgi:hypothetical protein